MSWAPLPPLSPPLPPAASCCLHCWSPPGPRLALQCPGVVLRLQRERKAEKRHALQPARELSVGSEGPALAMGCVMSLPHGQESRARAGAAGDGALQSVAPAQGRVCVVL